MGGRGSKSGIGGGAGGGGGSNGPITSAFGANDINELREYMYNTYGVSTTTDVDKMSFESARRAAGAVEQMLKEFPQAGPIISGSTSGAVIDATEWRSNAYASMSLKGKLNLSPKNMGDVDALKASYENDVKSHWHPEGTDYTHIATHEMGHFLEAALVHRQYAGEWWFTKVEAWNKRKEATRIISEAARAAKKRPEGKGKTNETLVGEISRYAQKNRSEALAEAVADYVANGSNAKVLSQEIWKILKRELG